jgi:RHS repeat-associated protein
VYAPIHDLYGNVAALISLSDPSHERYLYTAFGEERDPQPTLNPWRFASKRIDEETGLVYFGRRYYFPTYGRWLTPDPLGLDAGANLYAYVCNAPLTHVDLYGLFAMGSKEITSEDFKQMGVGAAHGVGSFALNTASAVSTVGWGVTSPFRAVNWMTGRSSFASDWNTFQRSNGAFHEWGERWMQRALPSSGNEMYRSFRSGFSRGMQWGTVFAGGVGIAKGAYSLVQKGFSSTKGMLTMQKIGRSTMQMRDITTVRTIELLEINKKIIHVTPQGIALPPSSKYKIPSHYIENVKRPGSYGIKVDGKFIEKLRIDPATLPNRKGPNYSHYHKDGKKTHYSPLTENTDPGFDP